MFRNYLKTALRSLWKNEGLSFFNIAGPGVGITACLKLFTILQFDPGFDGVHQTKDRVFRLMSIRGEQTNVHRLPNLALFTKYFF
ncbi:MAG: hypothetical protein J7527_06130 [Chitinophagaceae bacterium]|nr:hypothetical protein [Chitinophagaceae bacterium]